MTKTMGLTATEAAVISLMRKGADIELRLHSTKTGGTNQGARQALDQLSVATNWPVHKNHLGWWELGNALDRIRAIAYVRTPREHKLQEEN